MQPIPVIVCPECAGIEPGGYRGEQTGSPVTPPSSRFADNRGYLYCKRCGYVWRELAFLPEDAELDSEERTNFIRAEALAEQRNVQATNPGAFSAKQARNQALFFRLARTNARYGVSFSTTNQKQVLARVYDAEALCTILDLPPEVKAAAVHHLRVLTDKADLRDLASAPSEAFTVATVTLVMERFGIERDDAIDTMLSMFTRHGDPLISPEQYEAAYVALSGWYGRALWRDGPQDAPGNKHKESKK